MASNLSFVVSTKFPCTTITTGMENYQPDPVWRTTALGCKLLMLLQEIYNFRMTYEEGNGILRADNKTYPDIYARPIALSPYLLDHGSPIEQVINRRYGFIVRSSLEPFTSRAFFALPFSRSTWFSVLSMIILFTPLLYILGKWERRVVGAREEHSLVYELMLVLGACFQHIPPNTPILVSRRTAYLTLFMFAWLIYTYYSSNLLSHLVNDRVHKMTATQLAATDRQFLVLDSFQLTLESTGLPWYASAFVYSQPQFEGIRRKLKQMKPANISVGLTAVGTQEVAFLSDYVTVYPYINTYLDNEAICSLVEINIITDIKEFLYTSKTIPLKDQFRIGILKIKEAGLLKRIKQDRIYSPPKCTETPRTHACFQQIISPLILLGCAFFASAILLVIERAYYDQNKVWPFVN